MRSTVLGVGVGESMDDGAWFSHFWKPDFSVVHRYDEVPIWYLIVVYSVII